MAAVLDACCGARMFWFDKRDPRAVFMDNRVFSGVCCDGRTVSVEPDVVASFARMPFDDGSFRLVVFDPPHMRAGSDSWTAQKYGRLEPGWRDVVRDGFRECFRVLAPGGVLIFKWNECHVPVSEVLALTGERPLFGNRCGRAARSHWIVFMKEVRP